MSWVLSQPSSVQFRTLRHLYYMYEVSYSKFYVISFFWIIGDFIHHSKVPDADSQTPIVDVWPRNSINVGTNTVCGIYGARREE